MVRVHKLGYMVYEFYKVICAGYVYEDSAIIYLWHTEMHVRNPDERFFLKKRLSISKYVQN